jgi:DNA-binding transcriptional MerR regulator
MLANPTLRSKPALGLTLGELAGLLSNAEPRTAVLAERIRGWTKQKLIAPITGERGTGKHYRYDAHSVVHEVLLLNALANIGLPIASLPYIPAVLAEMRDKLPKWRRAQQRSKQIPPLFLRIWQRQMYPAAKIVTDIEINEIKIDPVDDSTIIVNLAQLFSQVVSKPRI